MNRLQFKTNEYNKTRLHIQTFQRACRGMLIRTGIVVVTLMIGPIGLSAAHGQSAIVRVLIPNSSNIRAVSLPSLHKGVFAAYGSRSSDSRAVIYAGRLSDSLGTPLRVIVAEGDPVPNRPGGTFHTLRIPTVWNRVVYFSGGGRTSSPDPADGLYGGTLDGGPLEVVSDYLNGLGPWIEGPFAGAAGIAYINREVSSGSGAGLSLYTYNRQWLPVATYLQPMPDGSFLQSTSDSMLGYGGGKIAYSVRCTYPSSPAGYGAYVYDTATGLTNSISNWATPIPGDGRLMDFITSIDTDGGEVSFVASNGNVYFGGTAAVCVAKSDGANLRAIARAGQPVPGVPGATFRSFGRTAVDQGIVYFQGMYFDGTAERTSLFADVNGVIIPIVLFNQTIQGVTGLTPSFDPRGVDGRDVVVMCVYVTNGNPFLPKYMLVHAQVKVRPSVQTETAVRN